MLSRDLGVRVELVQVLECLAWVAAMSGQSPRASRLGGASEALRQNLGVPLREDLRSGHHRALQTMRAALGDDAFVSAWAEGQALTLDEAVAVALEVEPVP